MLLCRRQVWNLRCQNPKLHLLAVAEVKSSALSNALNTGEGKGIAVGQRGPDIYYNRGRHGPKYSDPEPPKYAPTATAVQGTLQTLRLRSR